MPAPHWISVNRTNGHAHIGYMLATPVARTSAARQKPLR
ncbi:replication initiation protein [Aeromonas caviae]|nr:replication initiation protein [Aeromonas caviae]